MNDMLEKQKDITNIGYLSFWYPGVLLFTDREMKSS
jgi:hypothetical protein